MPDTSVRLYRFTPSQKPKSLQRATYYRRGRNRTHYELQPIDSSDPLATRLARVVNLYADQTRRLTNGKAYRVVGIGLEEAEDEIYIVCSHLYQSGTTLRCWPLYYFERLPRPRS